MPQQSGFPAVVGHEAGSPDHPVHRRRENAAAARGGGAKLGTHRHRILWCTLGGSLRERGGAPSGVWCFSAAAADCGVAGCRAGRMGVDRPRMQPRRVCSTGAGFGRSDDPRTRLARHGLQFKRRDGLLRWVGQSRQGVALTAPSRCAQATCLVTSRDPSGVRFLVSVSAGASKGCPTAAYPGRGRQSRASPKGAPRSGHAPREMQSPTI